MSRYIKLEDLQKFPIRVDHYDKENGNEHFVYGIESVLEYAESLPAADAVEVVRCKDCQYCDVDPLTGHVLTCHYPKHVLIESSSPRRIQVFSVNAEGFCNRGERREDNEG